MERRALPVGRASLVARLRPRPIRFIRPVVGNYHAKPPPDEHQGRYVDLRTDAYARMNPYLTALVRLLSHAAMRNDVKSVQKRSPRKMRPKAGDAIAVLEDAVRTLQRYAVANDRATRALVAEIDAWFACDDCDNPFTFASICTVLALNIAYTRSGYREERESRHVTLRAEPRVLCFTGRRRSAGRVTPSHLRGVPRTSPTRVAAASSALPPAPTPQPVRTASKRLGTS